MIEKIRNLKFLWARLNREIIRILFLTLWAIVTLVSLVFNFQTHQDKIVIIRETKTGDYVIPIEATKNSKTTSDKEERLLSFDDESLQKVNFIKRYMALIYNFDKSSVNEQVTKGSELMSEGFWNESQKKLYDLETSVSANTENMTQSFEVLSITKISQNVFDIGGRILTVKAGKNYGFEYVIEIKIREASRSLVNPWGLEVTSVHETRK